MGMKLLFRFRAACGLGMAAMMLFGLPLTDVRADASVLRHAALSLPAGFRASVFVSGLSNPTALAVGPDHRVYVAQQDGAVDVVAKTGLQTVASGFSAILGLAWYNHELYVSSTGTVGVLIPSNHYTRWKRRVLVSGLPTGRHQNDGLAFLGGWMYLGVGSTCNACAEADQRSATIMRFHDDGTHAQVFARGLRNPYGLAIRPGTHQLYATDNGRDDFGDSVPDELNLIVRGGRYGWPNCWGNHQGSHCGGTIAPIALFPAHASADGIGFYSGTAFGASYRGDAFVAEYGDTIDGLGTGHVVQVVHFGKRVTVGTFATGFVNPLAVAVSPNGSLLVADWGSGMVWRISRGRR